MSKECYTRYEVERQPWERWPRVLVVTEHDPRTGTAQRRYVPEDSAEVVRCRNCRHFYEDRRDTATGWVDVFTCDSEQWSTVSLMPSHEVEPDGFCAWGERRDG